MHPPDIEENFQKLLENDPEQFLSELKAELQYFQRTKIVTLLDVYRLRKRLLPMLDVWMYSEELSYESLLKLHENLLLHALRNEMNLSVVVQMINENKYIFRSGVRTLYNTLPQ